MLAMNLRKMRALAILAIASAVTPVPSHSWVVREDGVGPVKIGMSLPELNTLLHEKFSMPNSKEEQKCFYVAPAKHPHVAFMIGDGRLVRVDVDGPGVPTVEGVQVGESEKHALEVYGPRLKVEPHAYTGPEGHYLTIQSSGGRYGIRFETEKGKIERFYAGRYEAIQYIEGCQ
jgi:hypothetical protein